MKLTKKLLIILILLIPKIGYAKTYLGEFNYNNDNNIDNKTFNNESIDKSNIVISKGKTNITNSSIINNKKDNPSIVINNIESSLSLNKVNIETKNNDSYGILSNNTNEILINDSKITTNSASLYFNGCFNCNINNSKLISNNSYGIVLTDNNNIKISNVELTSKNESIYIYNSKENYIRDKNSNIDIKDSNITSNSKDNILISNTSGDIGIENSKLNNKKGNIINIKTLEVSNNKENGPRNGSVVTLNITNSNLKGNIEIDEHSAISMYLKNTTYKGSINNKKTATVINLVLLNDTNLILTDDTYVSSIDNPDHEDNSNIYANGHSLYVEGKKVKINNKKYNANDKNNEKITSSDNKGIFNNYLTMIFLPIAILIIGFIISYYLKNKKKNSKS